MNTTLTPSTKRHIKRRGPKGRPDSYWVELLTKYKELTTTDLANKINCSYGTVLLKRHKYNFPVFKPDSYWIELLTKYKDLTTIQLAKQTGHDYQILLLKRHKFNFPVGIRGRQECYKIKCPDLRRFLKDNNTRTYQDIGTEFGVSRQCIEQHYKKFGIERDFYGRWREDVKILVKDKPKVLTSKQLKDICTEISKSFITVKLFLESLGYKVRSKNLQLLDKGLRKCCACQKIKKLTEFTRCCANSTGYGYRCLPCGCVMQKRYYQLKQSKP